MDSQNVKYMKMKKNVNIVKQVIFLEIIFVNQYQYKLKIVNIMLMKKNVVNVMKVLYGNI